MALKGGPNILLLFAKRIFLDTNLSFTNAVISLKISTRILLKQNIELHFDIILLLFIFCDDFFFSGFLDVFPFPFPLSVR